MAAKGHRLRRANPVEAGIVGAQQEEEAHRCDCAENGEGIDAGDGHRPNGEARRCEDGLRIADFVVSDHVLRGQELGLGEFIWELEAGARKQVREVGIALGAGQADRTEETEGYMPSKFKAVPKFAPTKRICGWEQQQGIYSSIYRREVQQVQEDMFRADTGGEERSAHRAVAEEISRFRKA
jgi:hypothetical protein